MKGKIIQVFGSCIYLTITEYFLYNNFFVQYGDKNLLVFNKNKMQHKTKVVKNVTKYIFLQKRGHLEAKNILHGHTIQIITIVYNLIHNQYIIT